MTSIYKEDGKASIWPAVKGDKKWNPEFVEKLIEYTGFDSDNEDVHRDEPWLGGYDKSSFRTEEIYVDGGDIFVSGSVGPIHLSLRIPVKNIDSMQGFVRDLNELVSVESTSPGLYLKPGQFSEVRQRKVDGQGRVNLGKDYADKEVRVVVMDDE